MRARIRCLAWLPLLLFVSCIDFDGQTISYRYDVKKDQLRLFHAHERIYATSGREGLEKKEIRQLEELMRNEHAYFFSNWILEYDPSMLRDGLAQVDKELKKADADEKRELEARRQLFKRALASVTVTNGKFYLNEKKQLCGYQMVTVDDVSKFVIDYNRWASRYAESRIGRPDFDPRHEEQIRKMAKDGKWIEVNGNQITIRALATREVAEEMKDSDSLSWLKKICRKIEVEEPFMTLTLGDKAQDRTDLKVDSLNDGKYNTAVLNYLRQHYSVAESLDVDKIRRRFLKRGRRK